LDRNIKINLHMIKPTDTQTVIQIDRDRLTERHTDRLTETD